MTARTARATGLGALGAVSTGAASWWLLGSAVAGWPGRDAVALESALLFLSTASAGLLTCWASLLLVAATLRLVSQHRGVCPPGSGGSAPRAERAPATGPGLTGRVAAGLLVAAGVGLAPAAAAGAPATVVAVVSTAPGAPGGEAAPTWTTTAEAPGERGGEGVEGALVTGADASSPDPEVPVPGWTPTAEEPRRVLPASGEVGLVSTSASAPTEDEVVVRRGDTLWDIAARHLGEHATDQDVAEAWPRWFAANEDVIGSDPHLILPGQRLAVPAHGGAR